MTNIWIELFGYLGSTLVVVSMLMASVVKLRVINTAGSVISATYALIIGSYPLVLMNTCLIVINVYNLYKLLKTKNQYDTVITTLQDPFVRYFLSRYLEDMVGFFPDLHMVQTHANVVYIVCCGGNPAGVMLGRKDASGAVEVLVDYSVPAYRDCSVGKYLYSALREQGVKHLRFEQRCSDAHRAYLNKMDFAEQRGVYIKEL